MTRTSKLPVLDGQYTTTEIIGKGGGGCVIRAHDTRLGRDVALKILPGSLARAQVRRFFREAQRTARLDHPHIVEVYGFGLFRGRPCLVMAFVRGKSLAQLLEDAPGQRLPVARVAAIASQACDALSYAHGQGIIHRDVKPANILVTPGAGVTGEFVHLADFGIARDVIIGDDTTMVGKTAGTPEYMSPAQCEGRPPTEGDDIYSLGVSMYEALTGTRPFRRDTILRTMRAHVEFDPLPLHEVRPDVPAGLSTLVMDMISRAPGERPATAKDVGQRLKDYVFGSNPAMAAAPSTPVSGTAATLDHLEPPTPTPQVTEQPAASAADPAPRGHDARILAVAAGVLAVAVAVLVGMMVADPPDERAEHVAEDRMAADPPAEHVAQGRTAAGSTRGNSSDALRGALTRLPDLVGSKAVLDALRTRLGGRLAWGLPLTEARAALSSKDGWTYDEAATVGPSLVREWGERTSDRADRRRSLQLVFGDGGLRMVYPRFYDHIESVEVSRALERALGPPDERRQLGDMTEKGGIWRLSGAVVAHRTFCGASCWTGLRLGATLADVL